MLYYFGSKLHSFWSDKYENAEQKPRGFGYWFNGPTRSVQKQIHRRKLQYMVRIGDKKQEREILHVLFQMVKNRWALCLGD